MGTNGILSKRTRSWILTRFSDIIIIPKIKSTSNKFCVCWRSRNPQQGRWENKKSGQNGCVNKRPAKHKQRKMIFNQKTLSDTVTWVYVAANLIQFWARKDQGRTGGDYLRGPLTEMQIIPSFYNFLNSQTNYIVNNKSWPFFTVSKGFMMISKVVFINHYVQSVSHWRWMHWSGSPLHTSLFFFPPDIQAKYFSYHQVDKFANSRKWARHRQMFHMLGGTSAMRTKPTNDVKQKRRKNVSTSMTKAQANRTADVDNVYMSLFIGEWRMFSVQTQKETNGHTSLIRSPTNVTHIKNDFQVEMNGTAT